MNILDSEEMAVAQKQLISHFSQTKYSLKVPNQLQKSNLELFISSIFPLGKNQNEPQLRKIIPNITNIKKALQNDCNGPLKLFSLSLLALIYDHSPKNKQNGQAILLNSQLLQSIKCSLYSNDLDLKDIKNYDEGIDNLQAKAMIARFFHFITNLDSKQNNLKCIQWILQNNGLLLDIFVLFLRAILHKLEIEDANNFMSVLDLSDSVTNLIEYFDMKYRNFGNIFLFYEENQFLAIVKKQLIIGSYSQSEHIKRSQCQTKSDAINLGQQRQETIGKNTPDQFLNVKNFQFLSESSGSGGETHFSMRQSQIETPHFMENSDKFNFGKRKKEEEHTQDQRFKTEFNKIMMNSSSDSIFQQEIEENVCENIVSQEQFTKQCNFQKEKQFIELAAGIIYHGEEINHKECEKNKPQNQHKNAENIVFVKNKWNEIFTPKVGNQFNKEMFSSISNDIRFLSNQLNTNSILESGSNLDSKFNFDNSILCCQCIPFKKSRITVTSQVVSFTFNPNPSPNPNNKNIKFPTFFKNMRSSQISSSNGNLPKVNIISPKNQQQKNISPLKNGIRQQRKPAFLKFLKKEKPQVEYAQSQTSKSKQRQFSKQSLNHLSKYKSKFEIVDKNILEKINDKYTYFSKVLDDKEKNNILIETRSKKSRNQSSPKRQIQTQTGQTLKKYDSRDMNNPSLMSQPCITWKSNQNFYLQTNRNHLKANNIISINIKSQTFFKNSPNHITNPFPFANNQFQHQNAMKNSLSFNRRISPTREEKVIGEYLMKKY